MKKVSLILAIMLIVATLGCAFPGIAFATSETIYTGVLEDLQRDDTFDIAAFPAKEELSKDDKVIDVIQVAESNAGELFLYVYQPLEYKFTATEARISTTIGDNLSPKDYKLTLLERDGTLEKYKVEDLQVKSDVVRYYLIVQLARPYYKDIDGMSVPGATITGATENGNIINTVAYAIEKLFTACTIGDNVTYTDTHNDCIEVVTKCVGYIEYRNGFKWFTSYTNSFYVAFDTDIDMDVLYEAEVKFIPVAYKKWRNLVGKETFEYQRPEDPLTVNLTNEDSAHNSVGLFGNQYEWTRIESVDDFIKTENLPDETKQKLSDKKWVLRFYECERKELLQAGTGRTAITGKLVEDVTILRLRFMTNRIVYNLGVVDNKQSVSPDQPPDNNTDSLEGFEALLKQMQELWNKIVYGFNWLVDHWWYILIGIVAVAIVIWIIVAIVKACLKLGAKVVFTAIGKVLLLLLKIVLFPFTLLYYGIRGLTKKA